MPRIGAQKIPSSTLLLLFLDAVSIVLALLAAMVLRHGDQRLILVYLSDPSVWARVAFVVVVCESALYYCDLYERPEFSSGSEVFNRLLQALGSACLILALAYYLDDAISLGRGVTVMSWPMILVLMVVSRIVMGRADFSLYGPKRVLVVGTGSTGIAAVREILARPQLHLKVEGFLDESGENIGKSLVNPGIIGAVQDVESISLNRRIHRIILSLTERRGNMPVSQLLSLKFSGVEVQDAHSFIENVTGRIHLEQLSPSWLILSDGFRKSAFSYAVKRSFDIGAALIGLVLTLPILIVAAVAIWLETGRPVLFRQERVGLGGRTFKIVKFRSMHQNAETGGPTWAAKDDNRITRVGRFIRRYRIDELPQIFNVLRGEMSLIGPRPERQHFCQLVEQNIPLFALRHSVRPGITGWAQVKYQYGASIEESKTKLEYDFFYLKHMSLFLDVVILFETAKVMIYGRGAK